MERTPPESTSDAATETTRSPELLVISGMSGAGKGSAARVLEEFGWYVVDNLPVDLIDELLAKAAAEDDPITRLAIVVDVRSRRFQSTLPEMLGQFVDSSNARVLFLDASDEALIKRFNNVRRSHPLQREDGLADGIARERALLAPIRGRADLVVDTSALSVHDLRRRLEVPFGEPGFDFLVTVESFGFKHGAPADVDMLFDMRFLPNPHWVPELRPLTGRSTEVQDYVLSGEDAQRYLDAALTMIGLTIEGYRREGKRTATIGVGCTGGKHRSVATVESLSRTLATDPSLEVHCLHRDLGRE